MIPTRRSIPDNCQVYLTVAEIGRPVQADDLDQQIRVLLLEISQQRSQ